MSENIFATKKKRITVAIFFPASWLPLYYLACIWLQLTPISTSLLHDYTKWASHCLIPRPPPSSVYYTECKPKNKKQGRPGNEAKLHIWQSTPNYAFFYPRHTYAKGLSFCLSVCQFFCQSCEKILNLNVDRVRGLQHCMACKSMKTYIVSDPFSGIFVNELFNMHAVITVYGLRDLSWCFRFIFVHGLLI